MKNYKFSKRSKSNLITCDKQIQRVFMEVIKYYDCTVVEGHRPKNKQNYAYKIGRSQLKWPESSHNTKPSKAVDVVPYFRTKPHIRWNDMHSFIFFAGKVIAIADSLGVDLRWGGDWDSDSEFDDQSFNDYPHYELLREE